ncbi:MAG: aminotransferase class V-fold PLP-dependent enzyme [Calditrichaceae bacterium]|nr:aminotransferase class V-fold PLP-dependent enzyme [Calditrichaceae bacterium]MBN2707502.1 aminotransferase class V-fold PLP-dependent enzyme [Calditrichaceae bacterium]RQV95593.1 MAG: aminotransferase class V-fold PLP-dependent enzyme [Calditrichota bacterium]
MDFNDYRKLFPVTLQKIYLNHASISPLSSRVTDKLDEYIDDRSFGKIDVYKTAHETREKTRNLIAKLINADPDRIAFITNTSDGFNHLAQGLSWQAGDEIILTDYEFPSNVYPFLNLEKHGVKIRYVPNRRGLIKLDDIEKMINSKTKLLSISFVEFSNGFRNDLNSIGALCKSHDIIFSVDSIQGLGAIPLDVQKSKIDFISNGGHKWLMGLMGSGFMYIGKRLFEKINPAFTGWLGVENAWDFFNYNLDFLPDARRFEYATPNFMGITALCESVKLLMDAGINNIERHLLRLGKILVEQLTDLGMEFAGSMDSGEWSGIYSFSGKDIEQLFDYLGDNDIVCALRSGRIRLAPHFYNSEDEIKQVIHIIKQFYTK